MSGPKVVRIVTREEVLALCRSQLARVDSALSAWAAAGARHDCVSEAELGAAQARREELQELIKNDRLLDFQKQAGVEEAYLRDDLQVRLARVAEARAARRARARRMCETAASLSARLRAQGLGDATLLAALEGSNGREPEEAAIASGFELLESAAGQARASGRRALAEGLAEGVERLSFGDWLAANEADSGDPEIEKLERHLAEVELLGGDPGQLVQLRERLSKLGNEREDGGRGLRLDALGMETARLLQSSRAGARARAELDAALAEATAVGAPVDAFVSRAPAAASVEEIQDLAAAVSKAVADRRGAEAAHARRDAVLKGLAQLGYEVTEGMSAHWVEQGRLTLRSAQRSGYGVELAGGSDGGRVQMRPVAFTSGGHGPDPARDTDAETIWCGDVSSLRAQLARSGGDLLIDRALPVGATPLKRIEIAGTVPEAAAEAPALRSRTARD